MNNQTSSQIDHLNREAAEAVFAGRRGWSAYAVYRAKRFALNKYHNGLMRLWCWTSIQIGNHPHASPQERRFHVMTIHARHKLQEDIVEQTNTWIKKSAS